MEHISSGRPVSFLRSTNLRSTICISGPTVRSHLFGQRRLGSCRGISTRSTIATASICFRWHSIAVVQPWLRCGRLHETCLQANTLKTGRHATRPAGVLAQVKARPTREYKCVHLCCVPMSQHVRKPWARAGQQQQHCELLSDRMHSHDCESMTGRIGSKGAGIYEEHTWDGPAVGRRAGFTAVMPAGHLGRCSDGGRGRALRYHLPLRFIDGKRILSARRLLLHRTVSVRSRRGLWSSAAAFVNTTRVIPYTGRRGARN